MHGKGLGEEEKQVCFAVDRHVALASCYLNSHIRKSTAQWFLAYSRCSKSISFGVGSLLRWWGAIGAEALFISITLMKLVLLHFSRSLTSVMLLRSQVHDRWVGHSRWKVPCRGVERLLFTECPQLWARVWHRSGSHIKFTCYEVEGLDRRRWPFTFWFVLCVWNIYQSNPIHLI